MGRSSIVYVKNSIRWCLGKSVQIKNTWVCVTQNRIGIVRRGDSSEEIGSQLSKVENNDEEEFRSETSITKLWTRHGRIESGAVVKNRKGVSRLWRRKGICYQWKEKGQCSRKETGAVSVKRPKIAHKNQNTLPPRCRHAFWPTVSRGRSVSRKRSIRGKSNHGSFLRQPCRYYLRGTCTRTPCEYWHPSANSIKVKRVVRLETSVCFRITRLMNNQIKSRKRGTSQKEEKAMTRMLWLLRKVYHNWVVDHTTRMRWYLKEADSPGETRCQKSWDQFKEYGSPSLRYVKQVSGKRKNHGLEKYESKFLISEVPTLWNLRTDPIKRLNDSSDVPEARLGTWPKTYTSSKRKTKSQSAFPRRHGYSRLRQQKSRRKESL